MSAHAAVLRDLVRGRWGFEGVMVSDYGAIAELVLHGVADDLAEAAALALRAGIDIDLMGNAYLRGLPGALERGLVSIAEIDTAVRRILALKAALGLFEDPFRRGHGLPSERLAAHRALAREAAQGSIVLLTNHGGALPLAPGGGRIAVIGPLADARDDMLGPWAAGGRPEEMVTILEGLRTAFPARELATAPGVAIDGGDASGIPAALELLQPGGDTVDVDLGGTGPLEVGQLGHQLRDAGTDRIRFGTHIGDHASRSGDVRRDHRSSALRAM
jgi:beta-glucosidase